MHTEPNDQHKGHEFVYLLDGATVQIRVVITPEGDAAYVPDAEYEILDFAGDRGIWCDTCDTPLYGGQGGLSEDWQVVT